MRPQPAREASAASASMRRPRKQSRVLGGTSDSRCRRSLRQYIAATIYRNWAQYGNNTRRQGPFGWFLQSAVAPGKAQFKSVASIAGASFCRSDASSSFPANNEVRSRGPAVGGAIRSAEFYRCATTCCFAPRVGNDLAAFVSFAETFFHAVTERRGNDVRAHFVRGCVSSADDRQSKEQEGGEARGRREYDLSPADACPVRNVEAGNKRTVNVQSAFDEPESPLVIVPTSAEFDGDHDETASAPSPYD
jgi:hypothetical protein